MTAPRKDASERFLFWFLLVLLLVCVQVGVGYLIFQSLPDWNARGSFGDMFGSTSALFSALALAGVIYTTFLQRQELRLQRLELELTREELAKAAAAQQQSAQLLQQQIRLMEAEQEVENRERKLRNLPLLRTHGEVNDDFKSLVSFDVINFGATIRDIGITSSSPGKFSVEVDRADVLLGAGGIFQITINALQEVGPLFVFDLSFTDLSDETRTVSYLYDRVAHRLTAAEKSPP